MCSSEESGSRLTLPSDSQDEWNGVEEILRRPINDAAALDAVLTAFGSLDKEPRQCTFFTDIPGSEEAGLFDFDAFFASGLPLMIEVALAMPALFAGIEVPIFKTYSTWTEPQTVGKKSFAMNRRQCACLLAHSFFGSLKRPEGVQPNDFRFTVFDLFVGTARSPNSATTFLNYFTMLAKHGIDDGFVTFERQGYRKGPSPWQWVANDKPLCQVSLALRGRCRFRPLDAARTPLSQVSVADGALEDSPADVHAEFANAFIGGGVMTGDLCAAGT